MRARARARSGGWKATRHEKSSDLDPTMGPHVRRGRAAELKRDFFKLVARVIYGARSEPATSRIPSSCARFSLRRESCRDDFSIGWKKKKEKDRKHGKQTNVSIIALRMFLWYQNFVTFLLNTALQFAVSRFYFNERIIPTLIGNFSYLSDEFDKLLLTSKCKPC